MIWLLILLITTLIITVLGLILGLTNPQNTNVRYLLSIGIGIASVLNLVGQFIVRMKDKEIHEKIVTMLGETNIILRKNAERVIRTGATFLSILVVIGVSLLLGLYVLPLLLEITGGFSKLLIIMLKGLLGLIVAGAIGIAIFYAWLVYREHK